ncbi:hypothetical protein GCM10022377_13390 [Zhihengliuella alba]|uniref:HTH tetR-type domain-containing protein n=1 Tax=Zhihengliuella alba TaxID=547018 RepID=A0ABP7D5L5_9MICC
MNHSMGQSPPEMSERPPELNRREQNKALTRQTIADAALDLLRSGGAEALTAERVAEAAGVSRRTFFNYFPTLESALNVPMEVFLNQAVAQMTGMPAGVPVADAALRAMRDSIDEDALRPVAELFLLSTDNPQLERLQLSSWNECAERVLEIMREVSDAPELITTAFSHALLGTGRAAFLHWRSALDGDLSPASLTELKQCITDALGQLRDGFPAFVHAPQ